MLKYISIKRIKLYVFVIKFSIYKLLNRLKNEYRKYDFESFKISISRRIGYV